MTLFTWMKRALRNTGPHHSGNWLMASESTKRKYNRALLLTAVHRSGLVLQRRSLWWLETGAQEVTLPPLGVGAMRRGVPGLRPLEPRPEIAPGPGPPR